MSTNKESGTYHIDSYNVGTYNESGSCDSNHTEDTCEEKSQRLAEEAWNDLLKEKIKLQYENKIGLKMDKIAEIAADAAIALWKNKREKEELDQSTREKLFKASKE